MAERDGTGEHIFPKLLKLSLSAGCLAGARCIFWAFATDPHENFVQKELKYNGI